MSDNNPWEKVADKSYFRAVMGNIVGLGFGPKNPLACLRFGTTGNGTAPNYQIETADGTKHCFRGMGHAEAVEAGDEFAPNNLSLDLLSYMDVREMYSEVAEAVSQAIATRAEDIIRAADAGEPPVAVLIPDLSELISEGFYWRQAERDIGKMLTPDFEKAGRKRVGLTGLTFGRCYKRLH